MRDARGFLEVMERECAAEGLSLRAYAQRLGVHHTTLIHLKAGRSNPGHRLMEIVEGRYGACYARDYLFPKASEGATA